jgi:hypothetical protein
MVIAFLFSGVWGIFTRDPSSCLCRHGHFFEILCRKSVLCDVGSDEAKSDAIVDTVFVSTLFFDARYVRPWHRKNPVGSLNLQIKQVVWLEKRLRKFHKEPLYILTNVNRTFSNASQVYMPMLAPPRWCNEWHTLTFSKLYIVEFVKRIDRRVILLDTDLHILKSLRHLMLGSLSTPSMVFHDKDVFNSGLMVFDSSSIRTSPLTQAYLKYQYASFDAIKKKLRRPDGGDQTVWRLWFLHSNITLYELPLRFNTFAWKVNQTDVNWCTNINVLHKRVGLSRRCFHDST